jgi:hypothetical protein
MFFVLSFLFFKIRKQEGGTSPAQGEGLAARVGLKGAGG